MNIHVPCKGECLCVWCWCLGVATDSAEGFTESLFPLEYLSENKNSTNQNYELWITGTPEFLVWESLPYILTHLLYMENVGTQKEGKRIPTSQRIPGVASRLRLGLLSEYLLFYWELQQWSQTCIGRWKREEPMPVDSSKHWCGTGAG